MFQATQFSFWRPAFLQAALKEALHIAGRIDVLVNNAGMGYSGPVAEVKLDKIRQLYETNVFGAMAMVQVVFPHMVNQRKGRIVNIGSVAAYVHRFVLHSAQHLQGAQMHRFRLAPSQRKT